MSLVLFVVLLIACSQNSSNPEEEITVVKEVAVADTNVETSPGAAEIYDNAKTEAEAPPANLVVAADLTHETINALLNQMPLDTVRPSVYNSPNS